MMRCFIIILILFLNIVSAKGQEFTVMFYNTENLFDTSDDTLKEDEEFLPEGSRRWTHSRYWKKMDAISRVIVAAGEWETPALVGLCEVENLAVAGDLARGPLLLNAGYEVIHRESPDARGIDVCLLYRQDIVRVKDVRSWVPDSELNELFASRNILYVKTIIFTDTLHVILCHWPSRRGGTLASESIRDRMSLLLDSKIDSLLDTDNAGTAIMIMGDFNAAPDDPLIKRLSADERIINLSYGRNLRGEGSYRYRGTWEMIDQILVTSSMTDSTSVFTADMHKFEVFDAPFLLEDDPDYPGKRPLSTFRGFSWSDGYSDHLPVILRVSHR